MTIKSVLFASAAALLAVTGARAADAVVVPEPEPVEYVRVCDMYGAGFFYIPGTETCLAISGKVWFQLTFSSFDPAGGDTVGFNDYFGTNRQNYAANVEVDVQFDARNETEWGTLRSYIRVRGNWDAMNQVQAVSSSNAAVAPIGTAIGSFNYGTDGVARIDQAWLTIGGLRVGYTESAWNDTLTGGASSWGSHTWGGLYYAYQQRHLVQYSFAANGAFGTLSLEDDGNPNFMPDIVGVVGYGGGWGAVWVKGAYDEDTGNGTAGFLGARADGLSGVDGWAASAGLQVNIPNMAGSSFRLLGFYASNANAYSVGGRWSVLASYYHQFTPTFAASVGAQYIADTNFAAAGSPSLWGAELALIWTPVTNLELRTEINHDKATGLNGTTSGFLRLTRFF
jgi:hypothetical protein